MNNRKFAILLAKTTNSKTLLKQLVKTRNITVLYYVLENKHTDDNVMREILYTYSNSILPPTKLHDVRMMLAELAIHMPEELTSWVARTKDYHILCLLARRHDLPYGVQKQLAEHPESKVRYYIAANHNVAERLRLTAKHGVPNDYKLWED